MAEANLVTSFLGSLVQAWIRPVGLLVGALLLYHWPVLIHKTKLTLSGIANFLFSKDKSWKQPPDPKTYFASTTTPKKKKTIIFVRHGESTWNDTFNKGSHRTPLKFALGFFPGLIKSILYEIYLLLSGKMDSWFYDSPLSYFGLDQVEKLFNFLANDGKPTASAEEEKFIAILKAAPGASAESTIVCSSLRRALSTMVAGFRDRLLRKSQEKIIVIPSLQEISRNPDTMSITPPMTPVEPSWIDKSSTKCNFTLMFSKNVDMSRHTGNKSIRNSNGLLRMQEFCQFVFEPDKIPAHHVVIAGGHSIWFRAFFRTFLPYETKHISKTKKIVNAGCIAFDLWQSDDGEHYMVDPSSIVVVYGGFK